MWRETKEGLHRQFTFKDFVQAFEFMNQVAEVAEQQQHHPRWTNEWNKVEIWLSTHEAKGQVTAKDRVLAKAIDKIFQKTTLAKNDEQNTTKITEVKLFTDGGSRGNPGPAASGFVILDMAENTIVKRGEYIGITTNNQAEYKALLHGLETADELGAETVHVYMDSELIVKQMLGQYKVKSQDLLPIHQKVKEQIDSFKQVDFTHVPRALNKLADAEVNKALDKATAN